MKGKRRDGEAGGGGRRGVRKNIIGSESKGLQAAAGSGFIGFSAFQTSATMPSTWGAQPGVTTSASGSPDDLVKSPTGSSKSGIGRGRALKIVGGRGAGGASGQVLPPHYSGDDSYLAVVSKKLSKRDATTKIKALVELRTICRQVTVNTDPTPASSQIQQRKTWTITREREGVGAALDAGVTESGHVPTVEALGGMVPHWVFLYHRLTTEGDRRTREAANSTLLSMMKANRRAFQPWMTCLMGPWLCSQVDTALEVSAKAKESFLSVFPENKRASVLGRCAGGILSHVEFTLAQTPAALQEASGCTAEEAEQRSKRLTVSAICALAKLMETVGNETNERLCRAVGEQGSIPEGEQGDTGNDEMTYWKVFGEGLWEHLEDKRPIVRRSIYALVSASCRHAPALLHPRHISVDVPPAMRRREGQDAGNEIQGGVGDHAHQKQQQKHGVADGGGAEVKKTRTKTSRVARPSLLVRLLSEKEPSNHPMSWQAILLVLKEFKDMWRTDKGAEVVLPTLLGKLRKGAFLSTARSSYPCLLPLLASLSVDTLLLPGDARISREGDTSDGKGSRAAADKATPSSKSTITHAPFFVEFLQAVWAPIEVLPSERTGREEASACWLSDVISAHVECVAYLLLALPPPSDPTVSKGIEVSASPSITATDGPSDSKLTVVEGMAPTTETATIVTASLVRSIRSILLDGTDSPAVPGSSVSEFVCTGLGKSLRDTGAVEAIGEALGRALGQVHMGTEKATGMMSSTAWTGLAVWGAILEAFIEALHRRSWGVCWMADALVRGLKYVDVISKREDTKQSSCADGAHAASSLRDDSGGLRAMCRALFQHCVRCLGEEGNNDQETRASVEEMVVGQRDAPLVSFMASIARTLDLHQCLFPALHAPKRVFAAQIDVVPTTETAGFEGAREFYKQFLVPRLVATSAAADTTLINGNGGRVMRPEPLDGLKDLVGIYLASSGRRDEDFSYLVQEALRLAPSARLSSCTIALQLVPPGFSGSMPNLDHTVLQACGIVTDVPMARSARSLPHPGSITDLPAFLQACLGVWGGRKGTQPFISATTVALAADAAIKISTNEAITTAAVSGSGSPTESTSASGGTSPDRALVLLILEALLGALAAETSKSPPVSVTHEAFDVVEQRSLHLLLTAFRGCGEGGAAGRLWRNSGIRALKRIVGHTSTGDQPRTDQDGDRWEAFIDGAVEYIRSVMEGCEDDDRQINEVSPERASTLALEITELEQELGLGATPSWTKDSQVPYSDSCYTNEGALFPENQTSGQKVSKPAYPPVVWRLGLTRAEVWQSRREEAFHEALQGLQAGVRLTPIDLARSCVSSRWACRWECLSAMCNRLPSARARLAFLVEGVSCPRSSTSEVHLSDEGARIVGMALHEIVAAGVYVHLAHELQYHGDHGTSNEPVGISDLPPRLLFPSPTSALPSKSSGDGKRLRGSNLDTAGDPLGGLWKDLGVGMPRWCRPSASQDTAARQAAATVGTGVMNAALTHLAGECAKRSHKHSNVSINAATTHQDTGTGMTLGEQAGLSVGRRLASSGTPHPFTLLLPHDLWRVAFQQCSGNVSNNGIAESAPALDDTRCHDLLMSALSSAARSMAEDATRTCDSGGEAYAWWLSCAAEVTTGFLTAVVGEAFVLGLGLGDEANRLMATRCGTNKLLRPTLTELKPGAKLYTREGQRVTVIAEHTNDGSGQPYYTVRVEVDDASTETTLQEKQTERNRLFLVPPEQCPGEAQGRGKDWPTPCPWVVKFPVSARLADILKGPLLNIEQRLWDILRSQNSALKADQSALAFAASAAIRYCASACVRAVLLCSEVLSTGGIVQREAADNAVVDINFNRTSDNESGKANGYKVLWAEVGPKVINARDRWASAPIRPELILSAGRPELRRSTRNDKAVALSLSTSVLSAFLAGTPLLPPSEDPMQRLITMLGKPLMESAPTLNQDIGRDNDQVEAMRPSPGWKRAEALAGLLYLRDSADASCRIHSPRTPASLDSELCARTQRITGCTVAALMSNTESIGWGDMVLDVALARTASGYLAVDAARAHHDREVVHLEIMSNVLSWALRKFLLTGGRIAARASKHNCDNRVSDGDYALCLEVSRLLTAAAWDTRKGWGNGGSASVSPSRLLATNPADIARIWDGAYQLPIWRGLHAAMVGATGSPILQVCAFEVLEAVASRCVCNGKWASDRYYNDDGVPNLDAEVLAGEGEDTSTGEKEEETKQASNQSQGRSIVSRLAAALGGWGLASIQRSEGGDDDTGVVDEGARVGHRDDMPNAEAFEEEAKEQQDDLELIARCFPDELLLSIEALPSTIESLENHDQRDTRRKVYRRYAISRMEANEYDEEEEDTEIDDQNDGSGIHDDLDEPDAEYEEDSDREEEPDGKTVSLEGVNLDKGDEERQTGVSSRQEDLNTQAPEFHMRHLTGLNRNRRLRQCRREVQYNREMDGSTPGSVKSAITRRRLADGPSLTGPLLTWLLWLEHCRRVCKCDARVRAAARAFVMRAGALPPVLEACFRVLKASQGSGSRGTAAATRLGPAQAIRVSRLDTHNNPLDLARLALAVYFRTVIVFPALTRAWWGDDCPRGLRVWAAEFTRKHVSPAVIQIEADIIADATSKGIWDDGGDMSVRASATSRQVIASYVKEECTLEACIELPPEYPLRSVEVTCSKRMGVQEHRWRKWVLQIVTLLSLQDGSVLDAVMLWKKNVDKEFEGVEPCVICYGILHPRDMALPQLSCKTCKNRFHSTCLYKWFHTSHKSKCPICQQPWA